MPYVPMLALDNVRKGFLEREALDLILGHLPSYLHPPLISCSSPGGARARCSR